MSQRERIITFCLIAAIFAAGGWMLASHLGLTPSARNFAGAFSKVSTGMTEAEITARLGAPDDRTERFRLGQYKGNEHQYAEAAKSGAERYLIWQRGNVTYAVGINRNGIACYTGSGGT